MIRFLTKQINKIMEKEEINKYIDSLINDIHKLMLENEELKKDVERLRNGINNIVFKSDDGNYYNKFIVNTPLNIYFTDIDELLTNKTNK